jgi:hypothetical protein
MAVWCHHQVRDMQQHLSTCTQGCSCPASFASAIWPAVLSGKATQQLLLSTSETSVLQHNPVLPACMSATCCWGACSAVLAASGCVMDPWSLHKYLTGPTGSVARYKLHHSSEFLAPAHQLGSSCSSSGKGLSPAHKTHGGSQQ